MSLMFHLFLHFFLSLLAGVITWFFFGYQPISFLAAFFGGVLIDVDHFIDYFIAFGRNFRLTHFLKGYQFFKNDKIYVLFHGWEYVILLIIVIVSIEVSGESRALMWGVTIGAFFHLVTDCYINPGMSFKAYSFFYRYWKKFEIKELVTREHYADHVLRYSQVKNILKNL
ncbi:MAG: hypothetical protein HYV45_03955 [Candidatus Moranbacteria bacterium]|nr:hypothetical protein [Candidatus Moranbacteria bacterium]